MSARIAITVGSIAIALWLVFLAHTAIFVKPWRSLNGAGSWWIEVVVEFNQANEVRAWVASDQEYVPSPDVTVARLRLAAGPDYAGPWTPRGAEWDLRHHIFDGPDNAAWRINDDPSVQAAIHDALVRERDTNRYSMDPALPERYAAHAGGRLVVHFGPGALLHDGISLLLACGASLMTLLLMAAAAVWAMRWGRRRYRARRGHCEVCNYDLSGGSGSCPECGQRY